MYSEHSNPSLVEIGASGRAIGPRVAGSFGASVRVNPAPEGCREGTEGAGLVQYKTSPKDVQVISFNKPDTRLKRLKRLKRNTYLSGQLHSLPEPGFRPMQAWLITPTYDTKGTLGRGCRNWAPDHMSRATDAYRRWCKSKGLHAKYTWVAELQGNGNVHYHLVAWLPVGRAMPHWDRSNGKRNAFWPHGMTETAKLKTNCSYLMKYLSKMGEKHDFPHGLRLCGNGGLDLVARQIRSWHNLPQWVKTEYGVGDVVRKKYGLLVVETGELLPPMYKRRFFPGGMELIPLRDLPEVWQCDGKDRFFGPYSTLLGR
jgi:hypothetical protein